jgi:1,4-dihydroxy-2-naphthoate octaprenyltransferase
MTAGRAGGSGAERGASRATHRPRGPATWLAATRPGFLAVTAVAVLVGTIAAIHGGAAPRLPEAAAALAGALAAHAGANVLNDVHDARLGGDAINVDRVAPFTGGSRFIQDGVLDERTMAALAAALLAAVVPIGLWLAWRSGSGLVGIGLAGLALGWAYSAPPLALMTRGLGEAAVGLAWWLVVAGAAFVQAGRVDAPAAVAGVALAFSLVAILVLNQFPDLRADAAVGKRNAVVRLGPARARIGLPLLFVLAHATTLGGIAAGALPTACALSLVALPAGAFASAALWRHAREPARLAPAIRATIAAALLQGMGLAVGFAAAMR